jgi:endonuclease/exonuclease/phosphatase family metal-dependent hydrolase
MAHPDQSHELTVGLYDAAWPEAYCCDFVFVSADLSGRVVRVEVEARTQASDHQPLLVTLLD